MFRDILGEGKSVRTIFDLWRSIPTRFLSVAEEKYIWKKRDMVSIIYMVSTIKNSRNNVWGFLSVFLKALCGRTEYPICRRKV